MNAHHATPLKFLAPGWFSVVMGMSGLSLAWARATPTIGSFAHTVANVVGIFAACVLLLLLGLSLLRLRRHPEVLSEDFGHPVRHVFVAALPVSFILLSAVLTTLSGVSYFAQGLWFLGALSQLAVTLWVISRWLKISDATKSTDSFWPGITPALLIAVVGNVVVPLAGVRLGFPEWSAAQFGVGLFFWLVVMTLLIVRLAQHGIWPPRLLPTTFITVAPPSVIGLAIHQLGAPITLSWMAWGIAVFFLLWSMSLSRHIFRMPFAITFWALSFPLASFTALTLHLSELATAWFGVVGIALLILITLLVIWLTAKTIVGVYGGSLLMPEPPAQIALVKSAAVQ